MVSAGKLLWYKMKKHRKIWQYSKLITFGMVIVTFHGVTDYFRITAFPVTFYSSHTDFPHSVWKQVAGLHSHRRIPSKQWLDYTIPCHFLCMLLYNMISTGFVCFPLFIIFPVAPTLKRKRIVRSGWAACHRAGTPAFFVALSAISCTKNMS